jgi:hypothetical protein
MSDFFFELFLQVTRGQFGKLGNLDMIYWLKATTYSFLGKGTKGTIICRDNSNSVLAPLELNVSLAEAEMIAELFRTIGFPGRSLDVQKVADTSDCWTAFSLQVYLDDKQDTLSLGLQCSGFEGEDTKGLHGIFARLLQIGKVVDRGLWHDLTGQTVASS